ncbi:retrovirus-related pol polyprotein from transposon TNT 1-94 [Tanacetum coccineum]
MYVCPTVGFNCADTMADMNIPTNDVPAEQAPLYCQLDEQWFNLHKDILRDALQITPINDNNPFVAPPSGVMRLSNMSTLWDTHGIIHRSNIDYAERIWEEFVQLIQTFLTNKKRLTMTSPRKKKTTPLLISSIRFTKLIIHHLKTKHNIHPRTGSPLHYSHEDNFLGNLRFVRKDGKEVFGMPIPDALLNDAIKGAPYYVGYLAYVAEYQQYLDGEHGMAEEEVVPESLAPEATKVTIPRAAMQTNPSAPKATKVTKPAGDNTSKPKSTSSQPPKPKPAPTKPSKAVLEKNLKDLEAKNQGPARTVVIREPDSGRFQPLPGVQGKGKEKVKGKVAKVHNVKSSFQLVDEPDEEPAQPEPKPEPEHQGEGEEYDMEHAIQMSLESFQAQSQIHVGSVAIREPVAEATRPLPVVEGKGKAIVTEEQAAQSLWNPATEEVSTGPSAQPQDDTSANIVCESPSLADSEIGAGSDKINSRGDTEILQINEELGEDVEKQVDLEEKTVELDQDQAGSDPGETHESRPPPEHILMDEDQAGPDPEISRVALAGPDPKPTHDEFMTDFSTGTLSSMKNLKDAYAIGDQLINDKSTDDEPGKLNVEAEVKLSDLEQNNKNLDNTTRNLGSRVYTLELRDLPHKINEAVCENVKEAVQIALQAPLRDRFRDLSKEDMKEMLHQRMFETGSYKQLPEDIALYEALEASMERAQRDDFLTEKDKSRWKKSDTRDAPSSSSKQQSGPYTEQPVEDIPIQDSDNIFDSEDTDSAHLPKTKQRPEWLKPIPDDERLATPEPAWVIPTSHIPDAVNNWANALATTYKAPAENSLLEKTGDMQKFMNWYCQKMGKTELTQADLEGQAYEVVKPFYPDVIHLQFEMEYGPPGHVTIQTQFFFNKDLDYLRYGSKGSGQALSISKMKAARYHDFGLELLVPEHMWIDDVCTYDISASYGISHWWFNRQKFYIDRHTAESSRKVVRTHMRILSVVRIKAYSRYGYDYLKEITLRRADHQEYTIAEKDFKNLYPSDFEDLNLLLLQGHLNHLPGSDIRMLSTAVKLWTRNLVIRQRVEDFQLGIESYQKQLNLTKPGWDATGFEFKHDYTIIDSPRAVVFPVSNNERKIMRFNEIYKFSDGTLTNIIEALDYRVKEYKVNRLNLGMNTRFWTDKDVERSKEFIHSIERRLKTRRIFQNLECFVGGRVRDIDYRLLQRTKRSLHSILRNGLHTAYIFFASALPVIAFGEQLNRDTDGTLSSVETLTSTAICGIIHAIFGGQPLLILGVAEPTVIMYNYLYTFAKGRPELGKELFLAWAGWVCLWTAVMLCVLAILNACTLITRFTRVAGELFGMLISVLFMQEAVRVLAYGTGWIRSLIADYGVPLMVVVWTALSYSKPSQLPSQVPRRLFCPLPWDAGSLSHWTVIKDMVKVPALHVFSAIIPAMMIAALYFFDHSVAAQMAQQKEFNLKNPSAYHYDVLLLGIMGVDDMELENLKEAVMNSDGGETKGKFDPEKHIEAYLPVRVNEQRVTNLLQSTLVGFAVFAIPAIRRIPTSVLWGYFAYMSIDSLPGNQFWERIVYLFHQAARGFK